MRETKLAMMVRTGEDGNWSREAMEMVESSNRRWMGYKNVDANTNPIGHAAASVQLHHFPWTLEHTVRPCQRVMYAGTDLMPSTLFVLPVAVSIQVSGAHVQVRGHVRGHVTVSRVNNHGHEMRV